MDACGSGADVMASGSGGDCVHYWAHLKVNVTRSITKMAAN